jgi:hypothetical protein
MGEWRDAFVDVDVEVEVEVDPDQWLTPSHSNAMMYNAKGSQVYDMAEEMLRESENHIAHFRTLQHDVGR